MELIMLQLRRDVLGDSKQEDPIDPGYDDPIDDLLF